MGRRGRRRWWWWYRWWEGDKPTINNHKTKAQSQVHREASKPRRGRGEWWRAWEQTLVESSWTRGGGGGREIAHIVAKFGVGGLA